VRVAHLSDLHILNLEGAVPGRLFNKRLTGYANLRFRRGHKHKPEPVRLALGMLRELGVDHVVITGDLSNLALEGEFDRVVGLLTDASGLPASAISVVPGNHDVYTRGSSKKNRFATWFAPFLRCDLSEVTGSSTFPFVHFRGPLAIIGLSTAVPQLPFVAAGRLGRDQTAVLASVLAHPEVQRRTPLILQHHPIDNPKSRIKTLLEGLHDADAQLEAFGDRDALLLHGHWHRRLDRLVKTPGGGELRVIGATSASLLHEDRAKVAGFNLLDFDDVGKLTEVSTARFDAATRSFDVGTMH
jgi:3',5'-cyclic AMP phosphodiesterase CpdA